MAGAGVLFLRRRREAFGMLVAEAESVRHYGRRLQALHEFWFASTGDALLLLDAQGRINGTNPAGERLLGMRGMELTGRPLASFLKDECEARAAILKVVESRGEIPRKQPVVVRSVRGWETKAEVLVRRHASFKGDEVWVHLKIVGGLPTAGGDQG